MDESRMDALVHYVCARCLNPGKFGPAQLNRVLWYSDVYSFAESGESITGSVYIKRQFGPAPKNIAASLGRLAARQAIISRQLMNFGSFQTQFFSLTAPDISLFSASQISLVDAVLELVCNGQDRAEIWRPSQDAVWETAEIGEEIPFAAAAFGGHAGEIDEDDMSWARAEIDRIESIPVSS